MSTKEKEIMYRIISVELNKLKKPQHKFCQITTQNSYLHWSVIKLKIWPYNIEIINSPG